MSTHAPGAFPYHVVTGRNVTHVLMPQIVEEELSLGSWAMPFMAFCGVALYIFEPGVSSALLLLTLGVAVYTTLKPETKAWAAYHTALALPLAERIKLLQTAHDLAPKNDQIVLAMGVSFLEAGQHAEAITLLRQLSLRHPHDTVVESALAQANRTLLQRASAQAGRTM